MKKKITSKLVKELRDQTGAGMMDSKKALQESDGDVVTAIEVLKKRGLDIAKKKSNRATSQGLVHSYIHDGRVGVLLQVSCETDFVAKTEEFKELVHDLTLHIAASEPGDVEELLAQQYVRDQGVAVQDVLTAVVAKLGENIQIKRFIRYELGE